MAINPDIARTIFTDIQRVGGATSLYGRFMAREAQCLNSAASSVLASVPFSLYIAWEFCIAGVSISTGGKYATPKKISIRKNINIPKMARFYNASLDLGSYFIHEGNEVDIGA